MEKKKPFNEPDLVKKLAEGNLRFALDLYKQSTSSRSDNVFLSPFSISAALGLVFAGALGDTAEQMRHTMHLEGVGDHACIHRAFEDVISSARTADYLLCRLCLQAANAMYFHSDASVLPSFKMLLEDRYNTAVVTADFASDAEAVRREINWWVEQQTQGKVMELVNAEAVDATTQFILINAVYFSGEWKIPFDSRDTESSTFKTADGTEKTVPMMKRTGKYRLVSSSKLNCQLLLVPYVGDRLFLGILLPDDGDLVRLEKDLNADDLKSLLGEVSSSTIRLSLPRISLETSFRLREHLETLGMTHLFAKEKADLSGLTTVPNGLHLTDVMHKAVMDIAENRLDPCDKQDEVQEVDGDFTVDHPFILFVFDELTELILFIGRVTTC